MNAKNDNPAESEAVTPAAETAAESAADPKATASAASAAETSAEKTSAAKTSAAKTSKARAKKDAEPAAHGSAAAPAAAPAADAASATDSAAASEVAPAAAAATGEVAPVAAAPVQTVYVTAPQPPKPKGNRGFGILMSLAATVVFAAVYAGVAAILIMVVNSDGAAGVISGFFMNSLFYVPVLVFLVAMVLWALLANRTGWWSWVIGSLVVAALTYFASIGVFILTAGGFGLAPSQATAAFVAFAVNPALIAAALIARECAIWFGAAIAKRGRKVRERNYATWQAFEHEQAQKRAELGGVAAA